MKPIVIFARIVVGCLFIFSGLVKAIDPKGLSYKMQEFFEVWARDGFLPRLMHWLTEHSLWFSIFIITLEVILGVALLIGWQKKWVTFFLLLLTLFFTFLTAFVLFTGKIKACGCFGDCIPLTPVQTFTKDLCLVALILILLFRLKYIEPYFNSLIRGVVIAVSLLGVLYLQYHVQRHLPLKDCLPFKPGNNILELRKMPKDAIPAKYEYSFFYEKDGVKKEFTMASLPDSSWAFVERKQVLVQEGKNNIPLINDFSFANENGTDTTEAILNQTGLYYLLFIGNVDAYPKHWDKDINLVKSMGTKNPVYIITSNYAWAKKRFEPGTIIYNCDATAIKTAARSNPTLYKMEGPVVKQKWGWADFGKIKNP